ncbi:hypothetical protein [Agrobacterium genomosp. 2]|uniref:Uncharacterized protein n=1 Tax=Agrobacterium genomosp. 2 str. CFBP 5494 TaxID=1183436 RepID=A0A9W5F8C3_9HYPH|nr:hypothetical protein [Agrobacterium genomosp. 2]CUX03411.1 hypothetical protein AGR2A_pb10150 [Agrobacterium genomosp. 2 str. CFBP 5494]
MTASAPRRRFGLRPTIHVESLDLEQLVTESLIRIGADTVAALGLFDFYDEQTIRRIGWHMAGRTGTDFRIGRRLLQLTVPDGYLLPPLEYRMCLVTEPTDEEMYEAPLIHPYGIQLWQSGSSPAEWRINGSVCHPEWEPRLWCRLLYLHHDKRMAFTGEGWVRLGKRMHS